jgi:acyl-CoA hydrolase
MPPYFHSDVESCVDAVLSDVGKEIVLGIPIAIGKPNHFVNALLARAVQDPTIKLRIFTGLTFVKPSAGSEIERRFAEPLVERLFRGYPDLDYVRASKRGELPKNIEVHEFFFQAGALLNSSIAQQSYTSLNYTHVAKHVLNLGINVMAQLVAKRDSGARLSYSWSSNTDTTLDIAPALIQRRTAGEKVAIVGQVNSAMPFMEGEAAVPVDTFDHILDDPAYEFPLFAPPKQPVSLENYAAAIHVASLVKDGGTIQLGIGTFSDALTHTLLLRHKQNGRFGELANGVGAGRLHPRLPVEIAPYEKGLYGATELFVDGYLALYRGGILKRRVFGDAELKSSRMQEAFPSKSMRKACCFTLGSFSALRAFTRHCVIYR